MHVQMCLLLLVYFRRQELLIFYHQTFGSTRAMLTFGWLGMFFSAWVFDEIGIE